MGGGQAGDLSGAGEKMEGWKLEIGENCRQDPYGKPRAGTGATRGGKKAEET